MDRKRTVLLEAFGFVAGIALLLLALSDKFLLFNIDGTRSVFNAIIAFFAFFLAIVSFSVSPQAFRFRPYLAFSSLLLLVCCTSFVFSLLQPDTIVSMKGAINYFFKVFVIFQVIYFLGANRYSSARLMAPLLLFSVVASFSSLIYYLLSKLHVQLPILFFVSDAVDFKAFWLLSVQSVDGRLSYFFSEANKYAIFLVLPFYWALYVSITRKNILYGLIAAVFAFNLVLTGSFAVLSAIAIAAFFYLFARTRSRVFRYLSIVAGAAVLPGVYWFIRAYLYHGDLPGIPNKQVSFDTRLEEIRMGLESVSLRPFGLGLANWSEYAGILGNKGIGGIVLVEDLLRGGWVFFVLRWVLMLTVTFFSYRAISRRSPSSPFALAVFTIMCGSQIYGPMEQRLFLVALGLCLAVEFNWNLQHAKASG